LQKLNCDFYSGEYLPNNHVELHLAAMRPERSSPFKLSSGIAVDELFQERITNHVNRFIENSPCQNIIFSAEGLSYLRHDDEMNRLEAMAPGCKIEIVVYLRNAADFLASYRRTIRNTIPPVIEPDSFAYTENDSWLVDFNSRLAGFRTLLSG
jgi:hypothetical protein